MVSSPKNEVLRLLNSKKLSPIGKKVGDINTRLLEDELSKHPLIENVECYRTPGRKIGIEVTQRLPLLRVMAANGDNYYIDSKGKGDADTQQFGPCSCCYR